MRPSGRRKIQSNRCLTCETTFLDPDEEKHLGNRYVDLETAARVLGLMMEGTSVRAISRLTVADRAWRFMQDLRARTENTFQLSTDGLRRYPDAVDARGNHQYKLGNERLAGGLER